MAWEARSRPSMRAAVTLLIPDDRGRGDAAGDDAAVVDDVDDCEISVRLRAPEIVGAAAGSGQDDPGRGRRVLGSGIDQQGERIDRCRGQRLELTGLGLLHRTPGRSADVVGVGPQLEGPDDHRRLRAERPAMERSRAPRLEAIRTDVVRDQPRSGAPPFDGGARGPGEHEVDGRGPHLQVTRGGRMGRGERGLRGETELASGVLLDHGQMGEETMDRPPVVVDDSGPLPRGQAIEEVRQHRGLRQVDLPGRHRLRPSTWSPAERVEEVGADRPRRRLGCQLGQ
jgi:hypothetical protein